MKVASVTRSKGGRCRARPGVTVELLALAALAAWAVLPRPAFAYPVSPRPAFFHPAEFPMGAKPPEGQISDGLYWLLSDEQEDVAAHAHFRHYARKVMSAAGLAEVSEISIVFDPAYEKLECHQITLWRQGRPRELLPRLTPTWLRREEDWEEMGMLDGRKTLLFALEDVRVGDVVEFAYTLRGDNPIFGGKSAGTLELQYGVPVERLVVRLRHPLTRQIHLTLRGGTAGGGKAAGVEQPAPSRDGGSEILTWDRRHVPARLEEDDAPSWYAPFPQVEWSEFRSWGDVVKWAQDLYAVKEPLSPELRGFVESLRPLDRKEQIRRTLRMVQDQVRYLGLEMGSSSHKPAHPNVVYARRFGDCKDKALLFCALMRELGFEAAPVLINTEAKAETERFQPSALAFDHVIARVTLEGRRYWFDATMTHQGGDPLENQTLPYGEGLAIAPGNGAFEKIEMRGADKSRVRVRESIRLPAWDSAATLEVTTEYTGAEAEDMRSQFAQDSREQLVRQNLNYHARTYPRIRTLDSLRIADDTAANRITVRETYAVDSLCAPSATGRAECDIWPREVAGWVDVPDRKIRTAPFELAYPKNVEEEIDLELPEPVAFNDDVRTLSTPDFRLSWKETRSGKRLSLAYAYSALADHVPLERFPAYVQAMDTIRSNLGATLYPASAGWPGFARLNYLLVFFCLGWTLAGAWAARSLAALGPRSARPDADASVSVAGRPDRRPIGGLLRLLAVVLPITPFIRLAMFRDILPLFDAATWNSLADAQGHPWRVPGLLGFTAWEIVCNCAFVGLWPLFFGRRRSFPRAFALVCAASLVSRWGYFALQQSFPGEFLAAGGDIGVAGLMGNLVVTLLWMAYVWKSRRAVETFVLESAGQEPDSAPELKAVPARRDFSPSSGIDP